MSIVLKEQFIWLLVFHLCFFAVRQVYFMSMLGKENRSYNLYTQFSLDNYGSFVSSSCKLYQTWECTLPITCPCLVLYPHQLERCSPFAGLFTTDTTSPASSLAAVWIHQCTLHSTHITLNTAYFKLNTAYGIFHTAQGALPTAHCMFHTKQYARHNTS